MNKKILAFLLAAALIFALAFSAGAVCKRAYAADAAAPFENYQIGTSAPYVPEDESQHEDATILLYGSADVPGYTLPDEGITPEKGSVVKPVLICVVIGLVIALIVTLSVKSSYKPVRRKRDATEYLVDGSLHITAASEQFVRSETSERTIEKKTDNT